MTLGVLGGTFNPIHLGHIAAAAAAEDALGLDRILLVPSRLPPHRPESAQMSAGHRLTMTTLVAAERSNWSASNIELERDGPSYTFDTLSDLVRTGRAPSQIFFIIGADAFAEIATWSRYPGVLALAHFAVVARPGITLDSLQRRLPDLAERMTTPELFKSRAAAGPPARQPRRSGSLKLGDETSVILIEAATPNVSSTEIRRRVTAGDSIAGLVPDSVATYISRHRLYAEAGL